MDLNLNELQHLLMKYYSRRQLEYLYREYFQPMVEQGPDVLSEEVMEEMRQLSPALNHPRNTLRLANLLCMLWATQSWFDVFFQRLDPEVQAVLTALIWTPELDEKDVQLKLGISVKEKNEFSADSGVLKPKFQALPYTSQESFSMNQGQQKFFKFSLPARLRLFLARYFETPTYLKLEEAQELKKCSYHWEDDGRIFVELPLVRIYHTNGGVKFSSRGKPLASSVNPMRKKLGLLEFFEEGDKQLQSIRTSLLLAIWTNIGTSLPPELDGLSLLEALVDRFWDNQFESEELLVHLQRSASLPPFYRPELGNTFRELLKQLPLDRWVEVERAKNWASFRELATGGIPLPVALSEFSYKDADGQKTRMNEEVYPLMVADATFKGSCYVLAALGLLDIQYEEPDTEALGESWFSPYDQLKYLRITELGAYLCGKTDTYIPPEFEERPSFTLSKQHLQILVDPHANPAKHEVLQRMGNSLATRRFEITAESFLGNCKDLTELERLIGLFRQNIAENPPQIWEAFFEQLREQAGKLKPVEGMLVFEVAEDRELVRILARDEVLRKLITRAEGYRILVAASDEADFVQRMKKLGYLL
jgi:hypothetical protein